MEVTELFVQVIIRFFSFILELICTSEFFKKLKLYGSASAISAFWEAHKCKFNFKLNEKNRMITYQWYNHEEIRAEKVPEDVFWGHCFSHLRNLFLEFQSKTFVIALHDIIGPHYFSLSFWQS